MLFHNLRKTKNFDGLIWIGPSEHAYCQCCISGRKTRLKYGIGIHFYDVENGYNTVAGRSCYKNLTSLKEKDFPIIGIGFHDSKRGTLSIAPEFGRKAQNYGLSENLEAAENVIIRRILLPNFGIDLKQDGLEDFVPMVSRGQLIMGDLVKKISRYVERGTKLALPRPDLFHARNLYVVATQLRALQRLDLSTNDRDWVNDMFKTLRTVGLWGLTEPQMKALEDVADRYDIELRIKGIRFPLNDLRMQQSLERGRQNKFDFD